MRYTIFLVACCCLLSACQSSPRKNYYMLTAAAMEQQSSAENITGVIGIGPIEVAEYLNRLHIVYQAEDGSLAVADNDYWAEPLDKGIARVLALNLTQRDISRSFVNFPWRADSNPVYSLRLYIHNLNRSNGQAHINATWELVDNQQKTKLQRRHFIRTTAVKPGTQALAQAYSQLFADLASEMDEALRQVP